MYSYEPRVPRILIIDDDYANKDRRRLLCKSLGLIEVSIESLPRSLLEAQMESNAGKYPVEVVFSSGQIDGINDLDSVIDLVKQGWSRQWRWGLILLDIYFPDSAGQDVDGFGLKILNRMADIGNEKITRAYSTDLPVVVLTSSTSSEVRFNSAGKARRYLPKSDLLPQKNNKINEKLGQENLRLCLESEGYIEDLGLDLHSEKSGFISRQQLFGRSLPHLECLRLARQYIQSAYWQHFLLLGDTGSGKSQLAYYMYAYAKVHVQQYAQSSNLFEFISEAGDVSHHRFDLFGHWKGAYNDANTSVAGMAERCNGSMLFIDEVGNLEAQAQTTLLQYLRLNRDGTRTIRRNGPLPANLHDKKNIAQHDVCGEIDANTGRINVRSLVILATNAKVDVKEWRENNAFRDDLYYRFKGALPPLRIPALCERMEDITLLFEANIARQLANQDPGCGSIKLTGPAREKLIKHTWPGNVAELVQVAQWATTQAEGFGIIVPQNILIEA